MKCLLAAPYAVARAVVIAVAAIWIVACCAGAYLALLFFWPFLSAIYLIVWSIARFIAHADTSGWGIEVQKRPGRLRRTRIAGSPALGKRVFVAADPELSVELAGPRWLEAAYLLLWGPFVLTGPLVVASALLQALGREEPQIVVEWSWLPIGVILLSGFYVSLVAFVSWAAREFVEPEVIGRRLAIPFLGHTICVAHRDVCAVDVDQDANRGDRIRLIRTGGEPMEIRAAARFMVGGRHADDLLPLAQLLARAARVPLR